MSLVFNLESASGGLVRDPTPGFSTQRVWGSGAESCISNTFPGEAGGAGHTWRSAWLSKGPTVAGSGVPAQKQETWFLEADMGVGTRVRNSLLQPPTLMLDPHRHTARSGMMGEHARASSH